MRSDLLALTEDSLVALANRGIVRRAAREIAEGRSPAMQVDSDDTVIGRFADGVITRLPASSTLDASPCTCRAPGVCRHKVAVVLAYQQMHAPAAASFEPWSPAAFSDEELEAALGARVMAAARQAYRRGYRAKVRRPSAVEAAPTVELGSCTVRFLVPHQIGYAHSDAVPGTRDDAVALAVWAFRTADTMGSQATELDLDIGGLSAETAEHAAASGIEPAIGLIEDLLNDGASHAGGSIEGALSVVRGKLERLNLRWPIDVVDDLSDQLDAYRNRSARYSADRYAGLLAELGARHRCVVGGGASLRSQVLGTEEAEETALRRLRLTGIGCRISGEADSRTARIYLVHGEAGVVLVMTKRWELKEDEAPTGSDLADRRLSGSTIALLAGGNVVTESAVRSARRGLHIASSRVAKTTVAKSAGNWQDLPDGILVRDLNALSSKLAGMPPRLVRPRIEADLVHVVQVGEVLGQRYEPGAQRLTARIQGASGGEAIISAYHHGITPGALDAMAAALQGSDQVRFVSGITYRFRGDVVIDPLAIVAGETVVIPDLAADRGSGAPVSHRAAPEEALVGAIDEAIGLSAEVAHRGVRHLPATFSERVERTCSRLRTVGMRQTADALHRLGATVQAGTTQRASSEWLDTHIRLLITAECL